MSQVTYSQFQQASIQAALKHFEHHQRVLCADEAGLGKTFIARGIIENMAEQKLKREYSIRKEELPEWWDHFCAQNKDKEIKTVHWDALKQFITNVFPEHCQQIISSCFYTSSGILRKKAKLLSSLQGMFSSYEIEVTSTLFSSFVQQLPKLIMMENGTGRQRDWDFMLPRSEEGRRTLPAEPFRVLYVCCNLAIAHQNTRRLIPLSQNGNRGKDGTPDRLSVLWYYLNEFPTPYLEIMPITATITTEDTLGNAKEREILKVLSGDTFNSQRERGEDITLACYRPDLVIFDEFQNFGDIIALCNMDEGAFQNYIHKLQQPQEADDPEGQLADREELPTRVAMLKRTRKIFSTLFSEKQPPKLLLLSATPFHTLTQTDKNINQISIQDILTFLGGTWADYLRTPDKEAYLYQTCGIFRTERIRLLEKDNAAYHLLKCDGAGLLAPAMRLYGTGQGNCAARAVFTTPHVDSVKTDYAGALAFYHCNHVDVVPERHPRYQRLLQVVTARDANDVTEQAPHLLRESQRLQQLLWIPPVRPSRPLGSIFAQYKDFSKTLVFSNLKITPRSLSSLLNEQITYGALSMDLKEQKKLESYLVSCLDRAGFQEGGTALCSYILQHGKAALCGNSATAEQVIRYCEDGCLEDVLREYRSLLDEAGDAKKTWNYLSSRDRQTAPGFAYLMETVMPEARSVFNAPFLPFVLATTSIGAEGLDFHLYCNRIAHYTRPSSVVALEQKNGRIDRRKSLAVRRWWAMPGNQFRLEQNIRELSEKSGGLIPMWDAGEGNLHYFFFYTEFTSEKQEILDLLQEQQTYRSQIGAYKIIDAHTFNLCPFLR